MGFGGVSAGKALSFASGPGGAIGYMAGQNDSGPAPFQIDAGPRPVAPTFQSLRDPNTGLLKNPNYNISWGNEITPDQRALESLRTEALSAPGQSPWEQTALQKQGLQEAGQRSAVGAQTAGAAANARANLASTRGLTSGASERLANSSLKDALMAKQGVAAQGAQARADIGLQGEQMRQSQLGNLVGQELNYLQPQFQNRQGELATQQYNISNSLQDKYAGDQAAQAKYAQDMQAWAAAQQANAISASAGGKKGGGGGGGGGGKK